MLPLCGADLQVCAGPPGPARRVTESAISGHEQADVDVGRRTGVLPHEQRRLLKMGKLCRLMRSAGPADRTVMQRPRAEIRMLCADMVEVCWKEPAGRKCKSTALLEDISPSGMCLQFEIPVSIGTHVDVHCPGDRLAGVVRYCVYREIGYFVGIELEPSSRWSRQQFEPQHLLDLEELVLRSARRAGETIH